MTTTDRRAGLGWPSDTVSGSASDGTSGTAAGLGWPVETRSGGARPDDADHDEEHA